MSVLSTMVKKEKTERILTFDLLRGYFLCVILFNHLQFYPSGLDLLTGRGYLYVSTAEGFFLVSGIILGIVRGRKLLHRPLKESAALLWKRALQLYLASIILTFLFTLIGQLFINNVGLKFGIYTDWTHWWNLLWQTMTLSYTYGWADFLRLYALFLFFAPVALWLLRMGKWYIVAAISLAVWALYPFFDDNIVLAQPLSWQVIFFAGFIIGYYWQTIIAWWRSRSITVRKTIGWSFVAVFIATFITSFVLVFGYELGGTTGAWLLDQHHNIEQYFNKDRLPIERLLLGTVWFWGLFYLVRYFEPWIIKRFGWLLLVFGANSLYVYTISAFVIFFIHLFVAPPGYDSLLSNLIASLVALGIVMLAVRTKFLMKIIPR